MRLTEIWTNTLLFIFIYLEFQINSKNILRLGVTNWFINDIKSFETYFVKFFYDKVWNWYQLFSYAARMVTNDIM